MRVTQAVMIHDIIGKPKIVLDQLREGFATLGFGAAMLKHPDIFEELFVCDHNVLDSGSIINSLKFPAVLTSDETTTHYCLVEYLLAGSQETLRRFLIFVTGVPVLPGFGLGKIEVKFYDDTAIFASTCQQSLTLPRKFPDKSTFNCSMDGVINSVSGTKSFNCV